MAFAAVVADAGGLALADSQVMRGGVLLSGLDVEHEYWRLLTSGFLHWSIMHLAVNMLSLYFIGPQLEQAFGTPRFVAIYLVGLLGGSAAVMALQHDIAATAGASGAIYGLLGAMLVTVVMLKLPVNSVLIVIGLNLVLSVSIPGISLWGHLGGLVFGALAALAVLWLPAKVLPPERRTAAAASRVGWYGIIGLAVVAVIIGSSLVAGASL